MMKDREDTSDSNNGVWNSTKKHLTYYMQGGNVRFSDITPEWIEGFKSTFLLLKAKMGSASGRTRFPATLLACV